MLLWIYTRIRHLPKQQQQQQKQAVCPKSALFCVTCCGMDLREQPISGAAQRRRQRRLRSWLRHERMTVAMALAERTHHSSRGQTIARAGEWGHELNYTATIRDPPTPQPELFSLYEEEPGGSRPDRIVTLSAPQERDLRICVVPCSRLSMQSLSSR